MNNRRRRKRRRREEVRKWWKIGREIEKHAGKRGKKRMEVRGRWR